MTKARYLAIACAAACTAAAAGPFDAMKGKMKDGMYEYKMEMDMGNIPGMPPGMKTQTMNFSKCVTQKDIEEGGFSKGKEARKGPENCEIRNMNMSGNTATYTMICKGEGNQPAMTADNRITFSDSGFKMDMKMAMNQGGQMMNMTQRMEGKYVGPCK